MAGARKKPNKSSGKYQGYYVDHTGRRVFFVGTTNRKETVRIAERLEDRARKVQLGYEVLPTAPARHRKRPFLEVVNEYIAWGRAFGRKDGRGWSNDYEKRTSGYLQRWTETLSIETLADLDGILPRVEAVLRELADKGLNGSTLAAYVKPMIALCNWCVGHGYLTENPLKRLSPIDETAERERRALTPEEIGRLFSVAKPRHRIAYAVALATGLRLSELRSLDREDLDIENSRLRLRWKQTKSKKAAYCYLPVKLTAALAAFADSGVPKQLYEKAGTRRALPAAPLLFVPTHLLRAFNRDLARAEIPKVTAEGALDIHGLRVASITLAEEAGATVKELQEHARHADPKLTLGVYAKKRDSRRAALAERIGATVDLDFECATGVHSTPYPEGAVARKSIPDQALSLTQNDMACSFTGTGPFPSLPRYLSGASPAITARSLSACRLHRSDIAGHFPRCPRCGDHHYR